MLFVIFAPSTFSFGLFALNGGLIFKLPDEVTGLIVGMFIKCLLIFSCYNPAFGCLLDRQANSAPLEIKVDNFDP